MGSLKPPEWVVFIGLAGANAPAIAVGVYGHPLAIRPPPKPSAPDTDSEAVFIGR
jgi:hypothetical protein